MKKSLLIFLSFIMLTLSVPAVTSAASASVTEVTCTAEGANHTFLKCNLDAWILGFPPDRVGAVNFTIEIQKRVDLWFTVETITLNRSLGTSVSTFHEQYQREYPNANFDEYRMKVTGYVTGAGLGKFPSGTYYSNAVDVGYILSLQAG